MDWLGITVGALRDCVSLTAAAYALSAVGLNLQFGAAGLLNFGHVASLSVGAYGMAIVVDLGGSFLLGVLVGLAAAALLGLLWGVTTLRLRADYLAVVTLSFGEILRFVIRSNWANPLTKSVYGIQRFADEFYGWNPIPAGNYGSSTTSFPFRFSERQLWVVAVCWGLVILATLLFRGLMRSPWGRAVKAVREDEDATLSLGKNAYMYKQQALIIGSMLGALGGIMLAVEQQNVHPDFYIPLVTISTFAIVILGGAGSVWGPLAGAILYWFLFEWLDGLIAAFIGEGYFGEILDGADAGLIRTVLVGIGLICLMIFRSQGLFGKRKEVLLGGT